MEGKISTGDMKRRGGKGREEKIWGKEGEDGCCEGKGMGRMVIWRKGRGGWVMDRKRRVGWVIGKGREGVDG